VLRREGFCLGTRLQTEILSRGVPASWRSWLHGCTGSCFRLPKSLAASPICSAGPLAPAGRWSYCFARLGSRNAFEARSTGPHRTSWDWLENMAPFDHWVSRGPRFNPDRPGSGALRLLHRCLGCLFLHARRWRCCSTLSSGMEHHRAIRAAALLEREAEM